MDTTGTATTKDWLEITKNMEIKAYVVAEDYALATGISRTWQEAVDDIILRRADAWRRLAMDEDSEERGVK